MTSEPFEGVNSLTDLEPRTNTGTWLDDKRRHTDAASMRRVFGIPKFDVSNFDYPSVYPGCVVHARDRIHGSSGGTDAAAFEAPDSGKTTFALGLAERLLEVNNRRDDGTREAVVWRGSQSRSEWTSFAPWATVCLPEACNVTAYVEPMRGGSRREVRLEDVVREVRTYKDPRDLFHNVVRPGKFHVVYPDPTFSGCQKLYEESARTYDLEFSYGDPARHWWIAAALARVDYGPYDSFVSFIWDEVEEVIPQSATKDEFDSYQKVDLFKDLYKGARKFLTSFFMFGHAPTDVHEKVRRKIRWRINLNRGNPTKSSEVVGVRNVPMNQDVVSRHNIGTGLMWTEQRFCYPLSWKDIPKPCSDELKVKVEPETEPSSSASESSGASDSSNPFGASGSSGSGGPAAADGGGREYRYDPSEDEGDTLDADRETKTPSEVPDEPCPVPGCDGGSGWVPTWHTLGEYPEAYKGAKCDGCGTHFELSEPGETRVLNVSEAFDSSDFADGSGGESA